MTQFFPHPYLTPLISLPMMAGKGTTESSKIVKERLLPVLKVNWMVWPAAQVRHHRYACSCRAMSYNPQQCARQQCIAILQVVHNLVPGSSILPTKTFEKLREPGDEARLYNVMSFFVNEPGFITPY